MSDLVTDVAAPIAEAGKELVDRLTPDVNARAKEIMDAQRDAETAALKAGSDAAEINKIEAASPHWFVAGWRPFLGWILDFCIAAYFIPMFIMNAIIYAILFYQSCKTAGGCALPPKPPVDITEVLSLLGTLLTGNVLRSVDKFLGTDTKVMAASAAGIKSVIAKVTTITKAAAKATKVLLPFALIITASSLVACGDIPPASILPQDQPSASAVVTPEKTIPFTCTGTAGRLDLSITVDGAEDARLLQAYLAHPSDDTAADFLNWVLKNRPDSLSNAQQIVALIKQNCST